MAENTEIIFELDKNTCGIFPGYKRIQYISVNDVASISVASGNQRQIALKANKKFSAINGRNIDVSEQSEGGTYNIEITCDLFGIRNNYDGKLDNLERDRYVIMVTDNNNLVWLAGSIDEPFRFSFKRITKTHYSLTFSRNTTNPLYILIN